MHRNTHDNIAPHKEDTCWIVGGVIISLALVAVVYFGLNLYTSF